MPSTHEVGPLRIFTIPCQAPFHELAHSTGHVTRLGRKHVTDHNAFGSREYAYEELVAEMASGFLCNYCGLGQTIKNTAAYIADWLKALDKDRTMVVNAAGAAQKATDYILGKQTTKEE